MQSKINIVWLKRDIRSQNHIPLDCAEREGLPYRIVYVFDPAILAHNDTSLRHLQFIHHSIQDLNKTLKAFGRQVEVFYGDSREVFGFIHAQNALCKVFSYEETGVQITWDRDKSVNTFFKDQGIVWYESPKDGVLRGIRNREGWDKHWFVTMSKPIIENTYTKSDLDLLRHSFLMPNSLKTQLDSYPSQYQPAGERNAWKYLKSFAEERGFKYHYLISKPLESRTACSRISTYLAWGNISIQQAYQYVKGHSNYTNHKRAFGGFLTRLKWHCHFIQKFEVECTYETICINRGYESLERDNDISALEAWKAGTTGYPLVDACMRAVIETGWINFRMRAMLVSFLCHHLDQDWRNGVYHLAQQFLDYEPGIHYPQFQMQAGTTGINTVRIYNPVKQSQDHDPEGVFIRKWVSELRDISISHIHEPWKLAPLEQQLIGLKEPQYSPPIVDLVESGKRARKKIWGHRKDPKVKEEKERILQTHTRRG